MSARFPSVAMLVPHAPPMLLIEAIESWEAPHLSCRAVVGQDCPLVSEGTTGALVALELIAQCAAVSAGLEAHGRGERVIAASVVAARGFRMHTGCFRAETPLVVHTTRTGGSLDAAAFDGEVRAAEGSLLAEGTITVVARTTGGAGA